MSHDEQLRVAVFTDHFSPQSSGGVEHVVWEVYRRLAARDTRVLVVTALERGWSSFGAVEGMDTHAVRIWDISRVVGAQVGVAPRLFRSVPRVIEEFDPDVLHANGLHFQSTLAAAHANRDRRRPMVLTSHVGKLDSLQQPTRMLTRAYERSLGRFVLGRCTRFISISRSVREHLETFGIAPGLIDDVPNGVDHERFHAGQTNDDRPSRPPLLMFVGRHMPNKGPQVFIEALGALRDQGVDFRAELLSSGPLRQRLERRANDLALDSRVTFRGHVPDVAAEMRRADLIVRPSFSEGMPLSLLEAMATRVCLVVSDVSGNYDLIRDGENGLMFPAGRADLLAAALKRAIESPELRHTLASAAWKDSLAFSWDRCATETLDALKRAIAEHGSARALGAAAGSNA
jgi:glycosyltransferase involved in cell wall biosynthesis